MSYKKRYKALRKEHAGLYNALWELVHAEHKIVITSELTHEQNVERLVRWMRARSRIHLPYGDTLYRELIETVLEGLFCTEDEPSA